MTNFLLPTLLAATLVAGGDTPADKDVVILGDYAPCGIVSLYLVAKIREVPADWEQVKTLVGPPGPDQTHSFADLSRAATQLGMHPVGLQVRREALKDLPLPAILQVRDSARPDESPHLLVLLRLEADGVTLLDAPYPPYFLPESQFASTWTGNVLVFAHSEGDAGQLRAAAQEPAWMRLALWVWVGAGGVLLICLLAGSVWLRRAIPSLPGVVRFRRQPRSSPRWRWSEPFPCCTSPDRPGNPLRPAAPSTARFTTSANWHPVRRLSGCESQTPGMRRCRSRTSVRRVPAQW